MPGSVGGELRKIELGQFCAAIGFDFCFHCDRVVFVNECLFAIALQRYKKNLRITNENSLKRIVTYQLYLECRIFALSKEIKGSAQAGETA